MFLHSCLFNAHRNIQKDKQLIEIITVKIKRQRMLRRCSLIKNGLIILRQSRISSICVIFQTEIKFFPLYLTTSVIFATAIWIR